VTWEIEERQRGGRDRAVRHQRFPDSIRWWSAGNIGCVNKLSSKRDWFYERYGVFRPVWWSGEFAFDVEEQAYVDGLLCRDRRVRDSVEGSAARHVLAKGK